MILFTLLIYLHYVDYNVDVVRYYILVIYNYNSNLMKSPIKFNEVLNYYITYMTYN